MHYSKGDHDMHFAIPEHDQLGDQLCEEIASAAPSVDAVWHVGGGAGSGKRSLLNRIRDRLSSAGMKPIRVSAPIGQHDSSAIASMHLAAGLKRYSLIDGDFLHFTDARCPWDQKLSILARGVSRGAEARVVLLCDEPSLWLRDPEGGTGTDVYQAHGRRFVEWLWNSIECRRVITGWAPDQRTRPRFFAMKRISSAEPLLKSSGAWDGLAEAAAELAQRGGQRLHDLTPLALRLLVCLAAIVGADTALEEITTAGGAKDLAERFAAALTASQEHARLVKTWARLALVRGPIDNALYQILKEPNLDSSEVAILERGMLDAERGNLILPRLLRQSIDPLTVLTETASRGIHGQVSEHYKMMASQLDDMAERCLFDVERFHHWVLKGDPSQPIQGEPFSVEQLHAAGSILSYVFRDHRSAVAVFERAVALDDRDDYGHHYLAFNLDWLAADIPWVERHYRRAIGLNPEHSWWWSRWICFLITIGRGYQAKQAWNDATDALSVDALPDDTGVFEALHLWVARLLLHRGQLDFAERVLNSTPTGVRREHVGFRALDRLLTALREAERGRGVFPLFIPPTEWWRRIPHLDFPPQVDGQPLIQWNPARIDHISGETIHLIVGKSPNGSISATYGAIAIDSQRFNAASLDDRAEDLAPGRFLELAFYGQQGLLRIRCHPVVSWRDPDLPPFVPGDPRRYLKKETSPA